MQITMQRTRPAWPENDPKLLKNSEGNHDDEWNFCLGQEADIALFLLETRIRKIIKALKKPSHSCAKQSDHKQRKLKHRNKISGSKCTNHK